MSRPVVVLGAATVLSAVTTVAVLSLSGCAPTPQPSAAAGSTSTIAATPADPGPLPPPEALADVMSRLADPAVPGTEKVALLEGGVSPDAAALDAFAAALRDGGFAPVTVTARDLRWADGPGDLLAVITITATKSAAQAGPAEFSYPLDFHLGPAGWQLTRDSAEALLAFGTAH